MKKNLANMNMAAITANAEMNENAETTQPVRVRRAQKPRKVFRNFSLSMELVDYEIFLDYLEENGVDSGSKLLRNLLRDAEILKSPKE